MAPKSAVSAPAASFHFENCCPRGYSRSSHFRFSVSASVAVLLIVERVGVQVDVVEDNAVCQPMSPKKAPGAVVHRNTSAPSALSLSPSTGRHASPKIEELICLGVAITNLSVFRSASADMRPGAAALLCGDVTTSFSVLSRSLITRFADYLIDGGLRVGDRVAVMLPNRPESRRRVLRCTAGPCGVVVLMSPSLSARAVEFCLTVTDARILFFAHPRCSGNHARGRDSRYATCCRWEL